jgi:hypothetical protein
MQKVEFGSDNAAHHINAAHVLVVWFQRPPHREARLDSTRQLVPTPQASKRDKCIDKPISRLSAGPKSKSRNEIRINTTIFDVVRVPASSHRFEAQACAHGRSDARKGIVSTARLRWNSQDGEPVGQMGRHSGHPVPADHLATRTREVSGTDQRVTLSDCTIGLQSL